VLSTLGHGQNAFLSVSCFSGGVLLLDRYKLLAGLCLGSLVYKPQLAIAVPITLLAAGRWRAIAGAAISSLGLCAVSYLGFGEAAWRGFFQASALGRRALQEGPIAPEKMQSVYAAVRVLHGGPAVAAAAQGVCALGVVAALGVAVARRQDGVAQGALMVSASLLCTPFLFDYDLCCLALPLAWVTAQAQATGWRPWEKVTLLAAYALPGVSRGLAMFAGLPVGPLVMLALFLVVRRRVMHPLVPPFALGADDRAYASASAGSASASVHSSP